MSEFGDDGASHSRSKARDTKQTLAIETTTRTFRSCQLRIQRLGSPLAASHHSSPGARRTREMSVMRANIWEGTSIPVHDHHDILEGRRLHL